MNLLASSDTLNLNQSLFEDKLVPLQRPSTGIGYCNYYRADLGQEQFFLKSGEKVEREIANMRELTHLGVAVLLPFKGVEFRSIGKLLVVPYIREAQVGHQSVLEFHRDITNKVQFEQFQRQALAAVATLNKIECPTSPPKTMNNYLERAIQKLASPLSAELSLAQIPGIDYSSTLANSKLFNVPIRYRHHNHFDGIPSVMEMITQSKKLIKSLEQLPQDHRIIHGDFHAPNVVRQNDRVLLIDLANVEFGADIAWDAAKWLNYVHRFYRIIEARNEPQATHENVLSWHEHSVEIHAPDAGRDSHSLFLDCIETFLPQTSINSEAFILKAKIGEFIVNLNTLNRHLKLYPGVFPLIMENVCDSYINIREYLA